MNVIRKGFKLTELITLNNTVARTYAFKSDLKIKWVKPVKVPCYKPEKSGDLKPFEKLNDNEIAPEFKHCKELETADELVRQLFTLKFHPSRKMHDVYIRSMMGGVQRHKLDSGSMESKIAKLTGAVRVLQDIMEKFPRNLVLKVELKEAIERRNKYLKYLRRWDYKKFEWILEKLNIEYKQGPPNGTRLPTRKGAYRILTDKYCENIREERFKEFRNILEEQQPSFLEEKIRILQFIRDEQKECGAEVTVSEEEINEVKKELEMMRESRRKQENDD